MLFKLYIENIAVIEKCEVEFDSGLNILTGETGAGKSIIINAIKAVLGQRISKDMIRSGSESAFVSASFVDISKEVEDYVNKLGFHLEEGALILEREISLNKRNSYRINSRPTTLSTLKDIGEHLINIHGQFETYGLLSSETHIEYIDAIGNLKEKIEDYEESYLKLNELKSKLDELNIDDTYKARKIDLLNYQINEIEEANITVGEEDKLNSLKKTYLNSQKIISTINEINENFNGNDISQGALGLIKNISDKLYELTEIFPEVNSITDRMSSLYYELEDCSSEIMNICNIPEMSNEEIEEIELRLDTIYKLKLKYGNNEEEILDFLKKSKDELNEIEFSEDRIRRLEDDIKVLEEEALRKANCISEKRKKISIEFEDKVRKELIFLDMPNVKLVVNIKKCQLNKHGCDNLTFLISTNIGEEPKDISKIASGGELSRIMLAIKNVLAKSDNIDTLIFDEVDTGISGSAAEKVGLKLKEVSKSRQIICITHLAQIASFGNKHFLIKKDINDNRTYTNIKSLSQDERVSEIARIIGGKTDATIKVAKEMLAHSRN